MTCFAQLADDSEDVPTLRNRKYSWFRMSKFEWDQVKLLYKLMKVSHYFLIPHRDTDFQ